MKSLRDRINLKKEKKKTEEEPGAVERTLQEAGIRMYRILRRILPEGCFHNAQVIREALAVLPGEKHRTEETFYAEKIAKSLAVVLAGIALAVFSHINTVRSSVVTDEGTIARSAYGAGSTETLLYAETGEGEALGEYTLDLEAQRYRRSEADRLFEEASLLLPGLITGKNESLDFVTQPLSLVKAIPGYPFQITWDSGNYIRLRSDGTPVTEDVAKEGETVALFAHYTYADMTWEQTLYVTVHMPVEDDAARTYREMGEALANAQEESVHEAEMVLPKTFRGEEVTWREVVSDTSPVIALLGLIGAAGVYLAQDNALKKRVREREEALSGAYPAFVSQLALYMGAGLTVRGIFLKTATDYEVRLAEGGKYSPLHEEIRRVANELKSGVSESVSYERFGVRCRLQEYAKLTALLTQNLKKGATGLLPLLREEAAHAVKERMDRARVRGEQAATKLMLPMMLMLAVVMLLVMVPAYMSF